MSAASAIRLLLTFGGSGLLMWVGARFMGTALRGMRIDGFSKVAVPMTA